jgi:hypothetical protein
VLKKHALSAFVLRQRIGKSRDFRAELFEAREGRKLGQQCRYRRLLGRVLQSFRRFVEEFRVVRHRVLDELDQRNRCAVEVFAAHVDAQLLFPVERLVAECDEVHSRIVREGEA